MDLKELQAFKTILVEGNFSKAAQKLHYAQSTITMQIQRLEKEIDFRLFDRSANLQLTPSGELFAKEVDGLIKHWSSVVDSARSIQKEEVGEINIGVVEPIAITKFPRIIAEFRKEKPFVTCNITIGNADSLGLLLEKQQLDFIIAGKPTKYYQHTVFEELYQEKIIFIVSRKFVELFSEKHKIDVLNKYPLFVSGENCLTYIQLEQLFEAPQQRPFHYSVGQLSNVSNFIHEFPSIGVVSSSVVLKDDVFKLPIDGIKSMISIGIYSKKEDIQYLSKSKQLILKLIRESLC
ncbi:hypothetical protein ATZ33_01440 [Enterococcus silesiacus]|uniref:Transcriptional regulator n=1 Tax=Enterococcus silesiacus TaxID=332949 RepID=A0A0S3K729_9ENTE|nr:LysR family transcriptional regulator [Enterococcus silesiacus]ALS00091.1 hypothetical protein ATZ33_01440 [Enterococcus silesiacus]OJG90979.1 transcriptional regulator [Enterococcus silesiacus]